MMARVVGDEETMAEMWAVFAKMTMPHVAVGSIQYEEMEKGFYAGASSLLHWLMVQMDEDREPTEADMKRMDAMAAELEAFFSARMPRVGEVN